MTHVSGRRDVWFWALSLLAVVSGVNALWMFVDPGHWYHELPAAVPDFGPLNAHFVRDIGCAFLAMAAALAWAAARPARRAPLATTAALFFVAHAVLHVHDTARGLVESHHWWLDLPGVYLPALFMVWAALAFWRAEEDFA